MTPTELAPSAGAPSCTPRHIPVSPYGVGASIFRAALGVAGVVARGIGPNPLTSPTPRGVNAADEAQKKDDVPNPVRTDLGAGRDGMLFELRDETWMSGIGVRAAEQMLADVAGATGVALAKR
ncbi:hypothetical protein O1Q96_18540 [Streptomyces sp. Qhu-G9]|uniref:hypothetical protein n=1 Tax=Streptomyces sp. Qhu-G9 TaxID=3452799 RepID=UPI0022ABFB80|nr:hypothetical protein [Streptomyces aurantiacus]WAU81605.1 hypothetical protein O1Q96_18540 [Streptomyces aurantiacus]